MFDPDERFSSEILSITPAQPGWVAHVAIEGQDTTTRKRTIDEENRYLVIAWALVKSRTGTEVEPVLSTPTGIEHATEHRRLYSDIEPKAGDPRTTVRIRVEQEPAGEA